MHRRRLIVFSSLLATVLVMPGCGRAATAEKVTGSVVAQEIVLPTPAVLPQGKSPVTPTRVRVATVAVHAGERVEAGQTLLAVDTTLLAAEARLAHAAAASAEASVAVLDTKLDATGDARAALPGKRREVETAIADATQARTVLTARLASAQAALASAQVPAAKTKIQAGIATLTAQLARVDAGLVQARAGLTRLTIAETTLVDAREQLTDARELMRLVAAASATGADLADARVSQATVSAPVAGTVVWTVMPGSTLAEGAPIAALRVAGPGRVRVWLPVSFARALSVGDSGRVTLDSLPGQNLPARVSFIGERASFPPTNLATRIIHLVRAVRVEVEITGTAELPPGTPADVVFEQ